MFVTNNNKLGKYFFYKVNGQVKKIFILGLSTINLSDLTSSTQVARNTFDTKVNSINTKLGRHIIGNFTLSTPPLASNNNSNVQVWLDKIASDGYTAPSQSKINILNDAFNYADSEGLTSKIDLLGLLKVEDQNHCKIPFIHSGGSAKRFTLENNPVFTVNQGLNSGGVGYLDTKWNPSTENVNYLVNNSSVGANVFGDISFANQKCAIGSIDGVSFVGVFPGQSDTPNNKAVIIINSVSSPAYDLTVTSPSGFTSGTLKDDIISAYKNGVVSSSVAQTGYILPTLNVYVCAANGLGNPFFIFDGDVQFFYLGSGDLDQTKMNTFVNMLLL